MLREAASQQVAECTRGSTAGIDRTHSEPPEPCSDRHSMQPAVSAEGPAGNGLVEFAAV